MPFNFIIKYKPRKSNLIDRLSKRPNYKGKIPINTYLLSPISNVPLPLSYKGNSLISLLILVLSILN